MATHSSVLAWRIPGTVEPDGLLSMLRPQSPALDWRQTCVQSSSAPQGSALGSRPALILNTSIPRALSSQSGSAFLAHLNPRSGSLLSQSWVSPGFPHGAAFQEVGPAKKSVHTKAL